MRTLTEFDNIKTPDSWKEAVRNYQNQEISELQERLQKHENAKITSGGIARRPFRVMLIAAAIVVLSCGSVMAYDAWSGNFNFEMTRIIWGMFSETDNDRMQQINQSVKDDNLTLTCTNVIAQDDMLCVQINVKTNDGSPFSEMADLKKGVTITHAFDNVELYLDGELEDNFGKWFYRIDDGSVASQADFEYVFYDQTGDTFLNKEIKLKLKDISDYHIIVNDIGITSNSLADLLAGVTLADMDDMTMYEKTAKGGSVDCYKLPVGNLRIPFSEKYPDSYIDNAGIGIYTMYDKTGEPNEVSVLYLAISAGNEDEFYALRDLLCVNVQTGHYPSNNLSRSGMVDDDRIIIALMPSKDPIYPPSENYPGHPIEFTNDMLQMYNLVCTDNFKREVTLMYEGEWQFEFKVDESLINAPKTVENIDVDTADGKAHIDTLTVRDMTIEMTGTLDFTGREKNSVHELIALVHEDGSITNYGAKPIGSYEFSDSDRTVKVELKWNAGTAHDISDVTAIRFLGMDIPVK